MWNLKYYSKTKLSVCVYVCVGGEGGAECNERSPNMTPKTQIKLEKIKIPLNLNLLYSKIDYKQGY